ncbi:MAG: methyltransferase domain-containing protein [Thermodesulfobacteriota bacterium]
MTTTAPAPGPTAAAIAAHYDATMYQPVFLDYFGGSQFANFGYWDREDLTQKEACQALMDRLFDLYAGHPPARALDVACGKGASTRALADRFPAAQVHGVNISVKQLATATTVAPGCGLAAMDAVALGFAGASFDLVVAVEAAFHFQTRERFFREAWRVLAPGGTLLLTDILMNREAESTLPFRSAANFLPDPAAYQALLARTGFGRIDVLDRTRECWHGCYWNMVRQAHASFLARRIDRPKLAAYLEKAYRMVGQVECYLLAAARKEGA